LLWRTGAVPTEAEATVIRPTHNTQELIMAKKKAKKKAAKKKK